TDTTMRQRITEHEARARRAEIDAVQKRLDVMGFGVAASLVKAVRHRAHTDVVTRLALLNRCLHVDVLLSMNRSGRIGVLWRLLATHLILQHGDADQTSVEIRVPVSSTLEHQCCRNLCFWKFVSLHPI